MGFLNSILAGVTLVRESIRSPNYVTGVSGWAIKQDGSAEFNNVTIRGNLVAGEIHIGTNPNTFNVDANGNLWMGAATFAAANFSVSNTGLVTIKTTTATPRIQFTDAATAPFEWPNIDVANAASGSRTVRIKSGKAGALTRSAVITLVSDDNPPGTLASIQLDARSIDLFASPSAVHLIVSSTGVAIQNGPLSVGGAITGTAITASGLLTGSASASITGNCNTSVQFNSFYNTAGSGSWANANLICNPGAGNVAIAWHPGGVAPQLRVGNGVENMFGRNSADSAYTTITAILVNASTRREKQDIEPWPPQPAGAAMGLLTAPRVRALDKAMALKPSTFRWEKKARLTTVRPKPKRNRKKGAPLGPDEYEHVDHECGVDCAGTEQEPCYRVRDWERPTLGLIAEDVLEVAPECVKLGADDLPIGLDAIAVAALILAAVQELAGDVAELAGEVKTLSNELGRPN